MDNLPLSLLIKIVCFYFKNELLTKHHEMAKLIIIRNAEYVNRIRTYRIYLDGVKLGSVANGAAKEFTIPAGQHQVYAKIDWCYSPTISFEVKEQETKTYQIGAFPNANWLVWVSIGILILHFFLSFTIHFPYVIYLVVAPFLVLFYYMTLGHKRYLSIKEF